MAFKNNKHLLHYVPHGINSDIFKQVDKTTKQYKDKHAELFGDKKYDFVVFYNSRNVQRKKTSNLILAFRTFCDSLPKEEASKCALLLHTELIQDAGTDLNAVITAVCPDYTVIVDERRHTPEEMALIYNMADVTCLPSSNEGFGLSIAESIMCEVPVIVTVTGGLQDQIGQTDDNGNPVNFELNFGTNNFKKFKNHGIWAKPIWPATISIQGSPPTPYIFDDICKWEDIAEAIAYWYVMSPEKRKKCGAEGRRWAMNEGGLNAKNMCNQFIKAMDYTLDNFIPRKQFDIHKIQEFTGHKSPSNSIGIEIPKIDLEKAKKESENI